MSFETDWNTLAASIHANAKAKGFWEGERNDAEAIALIHSELSEGLEALRAGNPASDKIPEFSNLEEEFADVVIRIMDFAAGRDLDVAGALIAKMGYNTTRAYKHGGKKF